MADVSERLAQPVSLLVLGSPRVMREDVPARFDTRKAIALLTRLAIEKRPVARETLALFLWPDYSHERARAALRRTLSVLRQVVGEALRSEGDLIEIDMSRLVLDVDLFRRHAAGCAEHAHALDERCSRCIECVIHATELYRGDFLSGLVIRDSAEFDDWQSFLAEALRRELGVALEFLVRGLARQGQVEQAVGYGARWLDLDPLNEGAHRELMRLHAWKGDRTRALRQYRECVSKLERELGVPPLEETTELYHAIREERLPAPPPTTRPPTDPTSQGRAGIQVLPFVGRHEERRMLSEAYTSIGPDGRLIVIEGEAGVGKTRLAEQLVSEAEHQGAIVLTARCNEDESGVPYGTAIDLLRAALERRPDKVAGVTVEHLIETSRLVPELAELFSGPATPPLLEGPGAQRRFLDSAAQLLAAGCAGRVPGVLFIDDCQWLDTASLDVLTYVARRLAGRPLCVLLTWRSEDVPDAHRLRRLLAQHRRSGLSAHVQLQRLNPSEVFALVDAAAPTGTDVEELSSVLYRETEGLAFFVVEYLATWHHQRDADGLALPGTVRELVHARLSGLTETAWQILTTAAVLGRSFNLDVVRDASGRADEETIAALEELIRRGLVVPDSEDREGRYAFGHDKTRTLVYEETSLARRRLLHRRVANALTRRRRDAEVLAPLIAQHYLAAGDEVRAAEQFRRAGEHARQLRANAQALNHFREALALDHPQSGVLHETIGDLLTLRGEYREAIQAYEAAAANAAPRDLPRLEHKLGGVHHRRGDWETAESHFRVVLESPERGFAEPTLRARVQADRSLNAHRAGRSAEARELARSALDDAERAADPAAVAQAHNMMGVLASHAGDLEGAEQHLEQSLKASDELGDPVGRVAALNNLALLLRVRGELEPARRLFDEALALCSAEGDRHREAAIHNNIADLLRMAGRREEAMAHLKTAVSIFSEVGEAARGEAEIWKLVEW